MCSVVALPDPGSGLKGMNVLQGLLLSSNLDATVTFVALLHA